MKKNRENEVNKALLSQKDQLKKSKHILKELEEEADNIESTQADNRTNLEDLESKMDGLLKTLGLDSKKVDMDKVSSIKLSKQERRHIERSLPNFDTVPTIKVGSWTEYQKNIDHYIEKYDLNLSLDPIQQMLSPDQIRKVEKDFEKKFGNIKWDKWDYAIVALAALLGFLIDLLLVKMPAGAADKYVPTNQKSPVGKFLNKASDRLFNPDNNQLIGKLEDWAKTPYDAVNVKNFEQVAGEAGRLKMNGKLHRLKNPGHDPSLLGLIFGVIDSLNGNITIFNQKGNLSVLSNPQYAGMNIFMAIIKTLAHFITDIGTSQGLVPPFFSLTQAITTDTPFEINDRGTVRKMRLNEVGERMYAVGGYNFNHFLGMSLTPLSIEIIIRAYNWLRYPSTELNVGKSYKQASMLTLAHTLTMSGNIIKMWINGWNPLAFNWAEMLMLFKSFYSLYKANQKRNKAIEEDLFNSWQDIYHGTVRP